jgi:hypothetical protein
MRKGRSKPGDPKGYSVSGFPNPGQINPGIYGDDAGRVASAQRVPSHSLALCNPDQTIASDDETFRGLGDVAEGDQLCQMRRRYCGSGRGDCDLDQRGELFGRQKPGRMHGHR